MRTTLLFSLSALTLLSACAGGERRATRDDTVLAIVGERTLRRSDLEARLLERYYGRRALLGLVRESLFELEARRLGVEILDTELDEAVRRRMENASDELDRQLESVGLDRSDVERELRFEIRNELLLERVCRSQREIGEREIQGLYVRTHALDRVAVRHIAIPFDQGLDAAAVSAARASADAALARVRSGEPFEDVARQVSRHPQTAARGGELGLVSRETPLAPDLKEAIFGLEIGEVSDPVREGDYGFHIFRIDRRIPAQPLEAVREELRATLLGAPPTEAEIAVVEQILRQRIPVTVFDVPPRPSPEDDG